MNQKKAKKLRKAIRESLPNSPVRALTVSQGYSMGPDPRGLVNLDGTRAMVPFYHRGTQRNAGGTQRALYREVKKSFA